LVSELNSLQVSIRQRNVLVAITDTHHGFLKGVIKYAREHDWHVVADMVYTAKIPFGWRGDGIVSFIGYRNDLADFVMSSGLPTVEISFLRSDLPLPKVGGDSQKIGRIAAKHFLERGYRNYAWAPFSNSDLNSERYQSFSQCLAESGFSCHQLSPLDTDDSESHPRNWALRRKKLITRLKHLPKPLAVFAYNDCVAADIIYACEVARIPVPESVAVLGVDNDPLFCELSRVPLSSIIHDLEGMAYEAAALLDRLMSGKKAPTKSILLPPKGLVTRRSTDILAVDNLHVARALRFIGDHYSNAQLDVSGIVKSAKVSRRPLEKAFRRELKRSINEEIVRVRLDKVRNLLVTTDLTVKEIASATGFSRPNHLYRTFRRNFGVTPTIYKGRLD
jgi:LacI family transcriptional regulator